VLDRYVEHHRQSKLPPSHAEQNEFARMNFQQETTRNALRDQHRMELQLVDYQHLLERTAVAAKWLAHDLKRTGSREDASAAASYEREEREALRAAGLAHERRKTLLVQRADPLGLDNAASSSTHGRPSPAAAESTHIRAPATPSQAQRVPASPQSAPEAAPSPDPNIYFKDRSGKLLTEDRVRAMLGRYEELREIRSMPASIHEGNGHDRLTTAQTTVRKNVLVRQSNLTELLNYEHLAERTGTSAEWLVHDANQPQYRAESRRAFTIARLACDRSAAIDPRTRTLNDRMRADNDEHAHRQSRAQEATKGGRTPSSEERANLPVAENTTRGRDTRSSEGSGGARPDQGRKPGGQQNSRGGGGRGGR
jgi:hypothetical protein